jgi:hypothetical protein
VPIRPRGKAKQELCHKYTSAQHTRHIDRKLFKLREMRGAGIVKVQYIPTDENTADLFTKVLKRQPFEKSTARWSGAGECTEEVKRQRVAALSAWETKSVFYAKPRQQGEAPFDKQTSRLCLRGERTWGETLD